MSTQTDNPEVRSRLSNSRQDRKPHPLPAGVKGPAFSLKTTPDQWISLSDFRESQSFFTEGERFWLIGVPMELCSLPIMPKYPAFRECCWPRKVITFLLDVDLKEALHPAWQLTYLLCDSRLHRRGIVV